MNSESKFECIARVRNTVMMHSQFKSNYEMLVEAHDLNARVGIAQHYLLTGESGTGKSTIKALLLKKFPSTWLSEKRVIPVLAIDTPSLPSVKNLAEEFLTQLGDPRYGRGSTIEKTSRILRYLHACDVKLVIIDEIQHFLDQGKRKAPREVADWLKSIIERGNVSTVLMGLERSAQILEINEQLRRRFCCHIKLQAFNIKSQKSCAEFIGAIKQLLTCFDLPTNIDLQSTELVAALHYATNGIMDYMIKLLIGSYEVAYRDRHVAIDKACLEIAFCERIWAAATDELNPFSKQFIPQRLDKRGMPFFKSQPE